MKMDYQEIKMVMRADARLANGLVNLLQDDTKQMCIDADDFDLFSLNEAIREAKRTSQSLIDTINKLEHDLQIAKEFA
jgi:hypothetical protein